MASNIYKGMKRWAFGCINIDFAIFKRAEQQNTIFSWNLFDINWNIVYKFTIIAGQEIVLILLVAL